MKVLVTGGAGFIGSHIVEKLLLQKYHVVIIDDLSTGLQENIHPDAKFIKMDIRSNQLINTFKEENFDFVIHQAAQTMVPKSLENPDFDCHVNILGTVNLLEACRKSSVKRVVFASSAAVYGDETTLPIKETANVNPSSFYGLSKLTVEKYLDLYYKLFGLEYVILRYANVYGERQGDAGEGGVISIFTRKLQNGETVQVYGDGGQTRDFIYVGDVAAANIQALLTPYANRVYNISTQTETSINTLLELLAKVSSSTAQRQYFAPREGDIYRSSLSNNTACHYLKWNPETTLIDGLSRTYTSLKK
jgi:Nucleoside-diphosphate-sugar epimerases